MDPFMHLNVDLEKGNGQMNAAEPLPEPPKSTKASYQINETPALDEPIQINPNELPELVQMTALSTVNPHHISWEALKLRKPSGQYFLIEVKPESGFAANIIRRADEFRPIDGDQKYSYEQILDIVNYGNAQRFTRLREKFDKNVDTQLHICRVWDVSLLDDLSCCLFGSTDASKAFFKLGRVDSASKMPFPFREKETFPEFDDLCRDGTFDQIPSRLEEIQNGQTGGVDDLDCMDMCILLSVMAKVSAIQCRAMPHSMLIHRIICFIEYSRKVICKDSKQCWSVEDFWEETRDSFKRLGFPVTLHGNLYEKLTQIAFFYHISSVLIGQDSLKCFGSPELVQNIFWGSKDFSANKRPLGELLSMQSENSDLRSNFLSYLGFCECESENNLRDLFQPLDGLTAANLFRGPFRIGFTNKPSEHLTFASGRNPVIRLLHLEQIKMLYIPQRIGLASAAGYPTLFMELIYSYILLFCANEESRKIGAKEKVDMVILDKYLQYTPSNSDFQLRHFPIYAPQLQYVLRKMDEWRAQTIWELGTRPYKDPLPFFAFWFGVWIGVVSVFGLGAAMAQTYASFRALN